jgi:hypothetical protein
MMLITEIAAILGMILGTAGLVISILNYLRDRPCVKVNVQWNVTSPDFPEPYCIIHITNTGRRPVFIMYVAFELPPGSSEPYLLLNATGERMLAEGKRLSEGDPPLVCTIANSKLTSYLNGSTQLRACAKDSTGRMYYAK